MSDDVASNPLRVLRRAAGRTLRPPAERVAGPLAVPRRFRPIFNDLLPSEIAVDCGAHVGRVTGVLAARGLVVHAFEPNPYAFRALAERFADEPLVACHEQAVALADGRARLHLHVNHCDDLSPARPGPPS